MSIKNWPAGIIRPVPVAPAGPYQDSAAPGVWTLDQQAYWAKQGLWPTAGNLDPSLFIENIFSTYLYTGNGSTQTITNGIDLSGKGGLVWIKSRSAIQDHRLFDTLRGATFHLATNSTDGQADTATSLTSFNSNGFSLGASSPVNQNTTTFASWTFREQAKFFDVVTYTGNGANRTIAHNLGSVPGTIIIKRTNAVGAWAVYHRSLANTEYLVLNTTAAKATGATYWNSTTPTSTEFSLGTATDVNTSGASYVAYLFAHDAGGFGAVGTDNVISCGSYTGNGSTTGPTVTLNYEPQWIMIKRTDTAGTDWWMFDNMRGLTMGADADLRANLTQAEEAVVNNINPTATGFSLQSTTAAVNASGGTYIYIAIRRGPMKTPTSGTSVFSPQIYTEIITNPTTLTTGWPTDLHLISRRTGTTTFYVADRLRGSVLGNENFLETPSTVAETDYSSSPPLFTSNTGIVITNLFNNTSGQTDISYQFRRAPGFFDVVCYSGDSTLGRAIQHNLAAIPELMIVKNRNNTENWVAYSSTLGNTKYLILNSTAASGTRAIWANTTPTSTNFYVGGSGVLGETNFSSYTYVAYLFATVTGVSKVGSYTGTGALQTVNCGFTSGARFVLIKRTDTTGDWWVYDSARGISSGNDPYLFLNSTAAEVTNTNYVDTASTGFQVTAAAPAGLNANGGTYIFLAIA